MSFSEQAQRKSNALEQVVKACRYMLLTDSVAADARRYIDNRLSKKAQERYSFGYFPTSSKLDNLISILGKEVLSEYSLIYPKLVSGSFVQKGHFTDHNLILPFYDAYGSVVSLMGRTLLSSKERKESKLQKYKYSIGADKDLHVYGLDLAKEAIIRKNCVIVVEGQFDCMALRENGVENVVAAGWANLSRYQFYKLRRYTNNIYLMYDNDKAGESARVKVKRRYCDYSNIKSITVPLGAKDIDECLTNIANQSEKKDVLNWLENAGSMNG